MIVLLPTENKILEIVGNCEPFTRLKIFCENLWISLNIYIFFSLLNSLLFKPKRIFMDITVDYFQIDENFCCFCCCQVINLPS